MSSQDISQQVSGWVSASPGTKWPGAIASLKALKEAEAAEPSEERP